MKFRLKLKRIKSWLIIGRQRRALLESYAWYRNLTGGYTHPHAMDYMTARQIRACDMETLEYKLQHGSLAIPPK